MAGRQHQVTYKKSAENLGAVARRVDKTDFPLRMRNGMAADLRAKEVVKDDDYVGISRGRVLSKRAARKSLPEFGLVILTNERLRIAIADDEGITDVELDRIRLTHDEDNVLTMIVRSLGGSPDPLTLVFAKRRSPVAQFMRKRFSDDEPGAQQGGRLQSKLSRFLPGS